MFSFIKKTQPLVTERGAASQLPSDIPSMTNQPSERPPSHNCVLLVDDEPHVLAVGKAVLVGQGFEVACAASGEIALELMKSSFDSGYRFPVIVLDLTMPGGASGFDVLCLMREIDADVPIIACSGYFQEDARDLCRGIGFYDVVHKPYNLNTLCTAVRRAIARAPDPLPEYQEVHADYELMQPT